MWLVIVVPKSAIPALAPRVETAVLQDTGTVGGATRNLHHLLIFQRLHQLGVVTVTAVAIAVERREEKERREGRGGRWSPGEGRK